MTSPARPRRRRLSPRKLPRQSRSHATVEAILEAATDILTREGAARCNTNRIAERAGVNIASLYQYFPGKHAIFAELRRRHGAEQRAAVRRILGEHRGRHLASTLRTLVSMGIAAHAVNPALHRALTEELPPLGYGEVAAEDQAVFAEFRRFLQAAVPAADADLVMWIIATVANAVIHRAVVDRPDDLSSGRIEDELSKLLVRYLKR